MIAVIFDTETTGLVENRTLPLDKQPEVIEFYACEVNLTRGRIRRELDLLIRPSRMPLPEKTRSLTGITDEMLETKPSFRMVADSIVEFLERRAKLVIAHNASFDKDVIEIELERLGMRIRWPRLICTIEQTVSVVGFRMSLDLLHEHLFNEKFTGAHRAREDVAALVRCCTELSKRGVI